MSFQSVQVAAEDGTVTLALAGELDLSDAAVLRRLLQPFEKQPLRLRVDLEQVTFLDTAALGLLLGVRKQLLNRGGDFWITGATGYPRQVMETTCVLELLTNPQHA